MTEKARPFLNLVNFITCICFTFINGKFKLKVVVIIQFDWDWRSKTIDISFFVLRPILNKYSYIF